MNVANLERVYFADVIQNTAKEIILDSQNKP